MTAIRNWLAVCCVLVAALITAPIGHSQFNGCGPGFCQGSAVFPLSGASVDLDFANNRTFGCNTFLDCFSITRATPATSYAQTSSGTLTGFAANTLRRTDLGLLIEEARTNLTLQSQTFDNASWTKDAGVVVTADQAAAPDGTTTADKAAFPASANNLYGGISLTTATAYTTSIYVKQGDAGGRYFQLFGRGAGFGATPYANLDLQTGALGDGAGTAFGRDVLGNGWYRLWFTATTTGAATNNGGPIYGIVDSNSATRGAAPSAPGFVYIWGADTEAGFLTSYIPTTTASVTRAADVVTATGALLTLLQGSALSHVISFTPLAIGSGANDMPVGFYPNGLNNDSGNLNHTSGVFGIYNGSTAIATANTATANALAKLGVSGSGAARSVVANNGTVVTDGNSLFGVGSLTSAKLGVSIGTNYSGIYQRLTVWNSRLPDATLKALTQ